MQQLLELRDLALRIAHEVASIPASAQPRAYGATALATTTKSSEVDLVTELDAQTEATISARIRAARPSDGILGEEGAASASESGFTWVVDPIDGTVNYVYGQPVWCIALGIVDAEGVPVVGVVHAPALRETYVGARGCGAQLWVDGECLDLVPPADVPFEMALLATGFSYDRERRLQMARVAADFVPRIRDLRRAGSAALDICGVAAGRLNGFYERDIKPWDRTAALAIAHEVGVVSTIDGDPSGANLTVVAPPRLAQRLRDELAALGVTG